MGYARTINRAVKRRLRTWLGLGTALRTATPPPEPTVASKRLFSPAALADLAGYFANSRTPPETWTAPARPPWVEEWLKSGKAPNRLAMDSVPFEQMADYAMSSSAWSEGLGFLGYAYLAELFQRPEYRRIPEIWAAETTRKWVKLKGGKPERLAKLEEAARHFGLREKIREAVELDGGFGRAHVFLDFGDELEALEDRLELTPETVPVDSLKNLKVVEPFWCYPLQFNTINPLADDFYSPSQWQVMTNTVHTTRMLTLVGRELPDILKPVYMFGGLSMTQMAKPYVDNFIRNRTSASNLLYSFSTMVLSTNMSVMLTPEGAQDFITRIQTFVFGRDNGGLMVVDKETEELKNVSAPLASVDKLLAQAQEFISSVVGIPLVVLLGVTPSGLNASTEGELQAFHAHILGYQEKTLRGPIETILRVLQLNLDGVIDDAITFEFEPLTDLDEGAEATKRQSNMTTDTGYITAGVLDPADVRTVLENEEGGRYFGMKLIEPEPPEDYDDTGGDPGGQDDPEGGDKPGEPRGANDADTQHWITVHPHGPDTEGQPLLISGSGVVLGGAGGKLNGQQLNATSMSKAIGGPAAPATGSEEHHKRPDETHSEHAHRLSERARKSGLAQHHHQAADAHRLAREELKATGGSGSWADQGSHYREAEHHEDMASFITHGPSWATDKANSLSAEANGYNLKDAKTSEQTRLQAQMHSDAYKAHQKAATATANNAQELLHNQAIQDHRQAWAKAMKKMKSLEKSEKKAALAQKALELEGQSGDGLRPFAERDAMHQGKTPEELQKHFQERFGLGLHLPTDAHKELKAFKASEFGKGRHRFSSDPETQAGYDAAKDKYQELLAASRGQHGMRVSTHSDVNLRANTPEAKEQRKILGHVQAALEHLERQGFDVKKALTEAGVHYAPGGTGKAIGHAYPLDGKSYFSMSHGKNNLAYHQEQEQFAANTREGDKRRIANGQQPIYRHSSVDEADHMKGTGAHYGPISTIIHEMVHAISQHANGQRDSGGGQKMRQLLQEHSAATGDNPHEFVGRMISRYGQKNMHEAEAELGAMVTAPTYVRGTLPKAFEDHVDNIFKHKGRTS